MCFGGFNGMMQKSKTNKKPTGKKSKNNKK